MLDLLALDQSVLSLFTSPVFAALKPLFFIITEVGSPTALYIYSLVLLAFGGNKARKFAFVLVPAILFGNAVVENVKYIIGRPRPHDGMAPTYIYTNAYSFPSGHATIAFLAAILILMLYNRKYGYLCLVAAALIGISRLVLDVHYPTDVLGGALLGIEMGGMTLVALTYGGNVWKDRLSDKIEGCSDRKRSIIEKYVFPIMAILLMPVPVLYGMRYSVLTVADLTIAALFIIWAAYRYKIGGSSGLPMVLILAAGAITSYAALMLGGYGLSLALIASTYLAILYFIGNKKDGKIDSIKNEDAQRKE